MIFLLLLLAFPSWTSSLPISLVENITSGMISSFPKGVDSSQGLLSQVGNLQKSTESSLKQLFGSDLVGRLRSIGRFAKNSSKTLREIIDIKGKLLEVPLAENFLKILEDPIGPWEINERIGVAPFFLDGDMNLSEEQLNHLEEALKYEKSKGNLRTKRQAKKGFFVKWPKNVVYYSFTSDFDEDEKATVRSALDVLQSQTCINFVHDPRAKFRIEIFRGAGCNAPLGFKRQVQTMSLDGPCLKSFGSLIHEFLHVLGFIHTHMRPDRDEYVIVNEAAVKKSYFEANFIKFPEKEVATYTPFEYGSILQYPAHAFSENGGFTIIPRDVKNFYTMGSERLTFYDIMMVNDHYGCTEKCSYKTSAKCKNAGVPNPRNCAICICPGGYGGPFCDQRPEGCGKTLEATLEWQDHSYGIGTPGETTDGRPYNYCHHWITAPKGKKIEVQVVELENGRCQYGCPFNGVEIKMNKNTRETNPNICCDSFVEKTHQSELNPTPVITHNRKGHMEVTLRFRYVDKFEFYSYKSTTSCMDTDSTCPFEVRNGFCTNPTYSLEHKKKFCAYSCNLCN